MVLDRYEEDPAQRPHCSAVDSAASEMLAMGKVAVSSGEGLGQFVCRDKGRQSLSSI